MFLVARCASGTCSGLGRNPCARVLPCGAASRWACVVPAVVQYGSLESYVRCRWALHVQREGKLELGKVIFFMGKSGTREEGRMSSTFHLDEAQKRFRASLWRSPNNLTGYHSTPIGDVFGRLTSWNLESIGCSDSAKCPLCATFFGRKSKCLAVMRFPNHNTTAASRINHVPPVLVCPVHCDARSCVRSSRRMNMFTAPATTANSRRGPVNTTNDEKLSLG